MKCGMCGDGSYNVELGMCIECGYYPTVDELCEWQMLYGEKLPEKCEDNEP